MRLLAPLVAACLALLLGAPAIASAAPPANDDFAAAEVLTGSSASTTGTTDEATKEAGEPNHRGSEGGHSVWYRWVAPADGTVVVDSAASPVATVVAAYTGPSVDGLTPIPTQGSWYEQRRIRFSATAGRTYHFAVDVPWGDTGAIALRLTRTDAPHNDPFATPEELIGVADLATGNNSSATRERGEPKLGWQREWGGATLWYEWTAPSSGGVTIDTAGSGIDTVVGVYTGDDVAGLIMVAANDNATASVRTSQATFSAVAGTTYRIQVDGVGPEDLGDVQVALSLRPPPVNDMFALAIPLPSAPAAVAVGNNEGATVEPGEPDHAFLGYSTGQRSVWYAWTAPETGSLTVKATASFQTVLAVYTGDSVAQLTRVANQPQDWNGKSEQIRVRVEAGVTYRIVVDSYAAYRTNVPTGDFSLSLTLIESPPNDDFANAEAIVGLDADLEGTNVGATQEPCEPRHDENRSDPSVWYEWTAPASGGVTLDTGGSDFTTVVGVYTGDSLCELARVPTTRTSATDQPARLRFRAAAGVTYRIAIDGAYARWGRFKLSLRHTAPPANDMFASSELLVGTEAQTTGNNLGATGEPGEPNPGGTAGASVWYSWTAPKSGLAVVQATTPDFLAGVAAYTGNSVGALTRARSVYSDHGSVWFRADAGETYRVAVHGGSQPVRGEFSLTLREFDSPANDDFANAIGLSGRSPDVTGTTGAATNETGEPTHDPDYPASVWYRWTAPADGRVTVFHGPMGVGQGVSIYTGEAVSSLERIGRGGFGSSVPLSFDATAGTTYRIAIAGRAATDFGKFRLVLEQGGPANDDFADAQEISGTQVTATGRNRNASEEIGEPRHYGNGGMSSVWYRWTAPVDGTASLRVDGIDFTAVHAVYVGSSLHALTPLGARTDYEPIRFKASAGVTYRIAVDGYAMSDPVGSFELALTLYAHPANDNFADATELSGEAVNRRGTVFSGSREEDEPRHFGSGDASAWYAWTAPTSASTRLAVDSDDPDSGFTVYTGTRFGELSRVVEGGGSKVFQPSAGETYLIAVSGDSVSDDATFNVILTQIESAPAPWDYGDANDAPEPAPQPELQEPAPRQPEAHAEGAQEESTVGPTHERASASSEPPAPSLASEPLSMTAIFPSQKLSKFLASGLSGTATCSKACSLKVLIKIDPLVAKRVGLLDSKLATLRATASGRAGVPTRLRVRVPRVVRTGLRRSKSVALTVQVTARSAGQISVVTRRVTVKR